MIQKVVDIAPQKAALANFWLGLLVCLIQACATTPAEVHSPLTPNMSCDDRLELGKQLEQRGADGDALKTYEPCLDSYPGAVALLARRYPPARDFLDRRREALNSSVVQSVSQLQDPPSKDLTLLVALNWGLDRRSDNVALFDRAAAVPALATTAQALHGFVWPQLVGLGRYADALRWEQNVRQSIDASTLVARVSRGEVAYESNVDHAIEDAALYARALSASGRSDDARAIFAKALELDKGPRTYAAFIQAASRAGDVELAKWIRGRASENLGEKEMQLVDQSLSPGTTNP